MTSFILRRYRETDAQFAAREFNYCMWQVGRCHDLQAQRNTMGWRDSAIFYQTQAAEWHERADECRARHAEAFAALIPGIAIRWDEIFTPTAKWHMTTNKIQANAIVAEGGIVVGIDLASGPDRQAFWPMFKTQRDALKFAYGKIKTGWLECTRCRYKNREDEFNPKCGHEAKYTVHTVTVTPRMKYDNPRDVPLTLNDISEHLKKWLA